MLKWAHEHRAVSSAEYMALIAFILAALLVFQRYIFRGIAGAWKVAGDAFGHGRQYDPRPFGKDGQGRGTMECFFDYTHCKPGRRQQYPCDNVEDRINTWIDRRCVEKSMDRGGWEGPCDCTIHPLIEWDNYNDRCLQCYADCRTPECGSDMSRR